MRSLFVLAAIVWLGVFAAPAHAQTTCVGVDTMTGYAGESNLSGTAGARFLGTIFTATEDCTLSQICVWSPDGQGAQNIKLLIIRDSDDVVIGQTGVVASDDATDGPFCGNVDAGSVVDGTAYILGGYPDPANGDARFNFATNGTMTNQRQSDTAGTYATPPATTSTAAGLAGGGQSEFAIYATGTTAGGSVVPIIMHNRRMRA